MFSVPNICFIIGLIVLLAWVCALVNDGGKRPKPFDMEGWDNGLAKVKNTKS